MNVLVIDADAIGLDFCVRSADAGHAVRWFRKTKSPRDGEGFKQVEVVDDWRPHMGWAKDGLIFATGNQKYLHELDRFRKDFGYKVFGPTVASARLEIEREAGMKAMQAAGVDIPAYETFDSLDEAEKFARKSDRAWVFKPLGSEEDTSLTYVPSDPADLVGWIQRKRASGLVLKGKCILQEKIDLLCELGVSGWMGSEGFLEDKWQVCIEHKKLMAGEHGPATGEMGTIAQYVENDRLADEMLAPMEPIVRALGHTGDFAVGAIIDKKGKPWFCEFTARAGCPIIFMQTASHRGDPAKWMRDSLDGKDTLRVSYDVSIGVVVAHPPFPYNEFPLSMVEGHPISGVEEHLEDVHCVSVMLGKGPRMDGGRVVEGTAYLTSGVYVLVATALGKTIERARRKVYATLDEVKFADRIFRIDIGEKVEEALPALHGFGYAEAMR